MILKGFKFTEAAVIVEIFKNGKRRAFAANIAKMKKFKLVWMRKYWVYFWRNNSMDSKFC